ncbi:metal transporter CNNM4-like [Bradysia coprophila]|uniref:metal transporter CNNM4-like n=1 Tax=Bradysia coprophila TaxID=38358 RepID=UPI00187DCD89|nr:metal transporter CNNM4-like [Bradysia coprophila]
MYVIARLLSRNFFIFLLNVAFVCCYLDGADVLQNTDDESLNAIRITGLRVENNEAEVSYSDRTVPELIENTKATLRLFGYGFTNGTVIMFTQSSCQATIHQEYSVLERGLSEFSSLVDIVVPPANDQDYRICARNGKDYVTVQGNQNWLLIRSNKVKVPLWLTVIVIAVCLVFSALFSGLNLGLMALDKTELKILINTGTKSERKYAKIIQPVRNLGNFLLCSILLGNVMVNATNAALMGGLTSGLFAVIFSTMLIVVFGEVIPQAICSRHGLLVGAKTIYITKLIMVLTSPLAYPISKVLDYLLGEEIGNVYSRERLKELVRVTTDGNDLDRDEVNIISGALDMKKKTVAESMTRIEDVFMLSYDAILDFETISEIMKSGYSRIPVYEGSRHNVQKLLLIKDLALIDPDDNTPLRTVCEFYQNYCYFVFEDVTLAAVFRQFKTGQHGHMAFVRRISNDGDPYSETIGLITLEDVIEELIQAEIMDETDITSNQLVMPKHQPHFEKTEYAAFAERRERIYITSQLSSASFQYLSTYVDAFKPELVSPTILHRLLKQDVIYQIKCKGKDKNDPSLVIFEQGKPADYFLLILEGRVEVIVGTEGLTFECGPFTFFGSDALVQNIGGVEHKESIRSIERKKSIRISEPKENIRGSLQSLNMNAIMKHAFEPDYTVKAIKDVLYIAIKRNLYLAALRATLMEKSQKMDDGGGNEVIDDDVKIFLNSLQDDYRQMKANEAANALSKTLSIKSHSPTGLQLEDISVGREPESKPEHMLLPPHI